MRSSRGYVRKRADAKTELSCSSQRYVREAMTNSPEDTPADRLAYYRQLEADARATLRDAAETSRGRDPGGLLLLAKWLSDTAFEALPLSSLAGAADELSQLGLRDVGDEPARWRQQLAESSYHDLYALLRLEGWLEPAPLD
jgi:hypothetical protein